ncbi:MAG: pentapeptide repeat-containing protein [Elainellaceae cyanobacterium]
MQLRNCNFLGRDLQYIDVSGADIRGSNFTGANLAGAVFQNVRAGLPKQYVVLHCIVSSLLSLLLGIFAGLSGVWISSLLSSDYVQTFTIFPAAAVITALVSALIVTLATRDLSVNLLLTILVVSSIIFSVTELSPVFAFTGLGAIASYWLVLGIQSVNLLLADRFIIAIILITGASATQSAFSLSRMHTEAFAISIALSCIPVSLYCSQMAARGEYKFRFILQLTLILRTLGSTSFQRANLTDADFSYSCLKNVNLWQAVLTRVRWQDVKLLNQAYTDNVQLKNARVRSLLTSLNGYQKCYDSLNLRGLNLDGADLEKASFKRSDLSDASVQSANLKDANLTETLCIRTNFSHAYFTGACLQEWNINHETNLSFIDCQYIFLLEHPNCHGDRDRRPHAPYKVFNPGDFELLYCKVTATVQLLLRDEIDATSFQTALQQVKSKHPNTCLMGVERKGFDTLVTLGIPEATDKSEIEQVWDDAYNMRLQAVETKTLLESERRRAEEMKEITLTTVSKLGSVLSHLTISNTNTVVADTKAMINSNDASRHVKIGHVGGDFNASDTAMNLGDVQPSSSRSIANQSVVENSSINGESRSYPSQRPLLQHQLSKLIAILGADATLSAQDRADALESAHFLREVAQDSTRLPAKSELQQAVHRLKRISQTIELSGNKLTNR